MDAAAAAVPDYIFEDEPAEILNTMLTLYFSATIMRCMQESVASELASRMTAMQSASNNAKKITNVLSQVLGYLILLVLIILRINWNN